MFIAERQPPKLRLLTSMKVLADQRQLNTRLVSIASHPDPSSIYVAFKIDDDRISLLHFQEMCLVNMYSFTVQTEISKSLSLVKLFRVVDAGKGGKSFLYVVIGYNNGTVSVYNFDNGLVKVRDLKSDSRQTAKDFVGDTRLFGVVRKTVVDFYSPMPEMNRVRTCKNANVICSCRLTSKLYISTHYGVCFYDRETLLREYAMEDSCFYSIAESQYSRNVLYMGGADDTLQVYDFAQKEKHVYQGFKSFVGSIVEQNQRLWAMGLDGRLAVFDINSSEMDDQAIPPTERTATRFKEHSHRLQHATKVHPQGVWHMQLEQDLMVLLDSEGWVVVYEILFPAQQTTERVSL